MTYRNHPSNQNNWSSIGYGMWGLAGWTGSDDEETFNSLCLAVNEGVNFFDTAWAYGEGASERMLGRLLKAFPDQKIYSASKIPPANRKWPALTSYSIQEVFPRGYIREYTIKTLQNLNIQQIDLMQFHVWNDLWYKENDWQEEVKELVQEGLVGSFGISVNRFEPNNVLKTLETGLIGTVQVVYNLFDQNPEDQLLPYCEKNKIGIIARVPFDEGSLTGRITAETRFPPEDWRSGYFNSENLKQTLPRVSIIREDLPEGMDLPELALRFILQNPAVTTVIPGMRKPAHVLANTNAGDGKMLSMEIYNKLKRHRWDRTPAQNPTP
jgi:aryl-alcohol dehydrogenase-like predicted oxidoreductase